MRERQPYFFRREEPGPTGPVFVYAWRDDGEILPWFLGWGAAVEVLDPPALRGRLRRAAEAVLARHADPPDSPGLEPAFETPDGTVSGGAP